MTTRPLGARSSVVLLALAALLSWACSGDPRPAATDGASTSSSGGGPNGPPGTPTDAGGDDAGVGRDAGPDAGEEAGAPPICNQVELGGAGVTETSTPGDPPMPTGGTIPTGTYELTARTFYPDVADLDATPSADPVQRTLVIIDADTLEISEELTETAGEAPVTRTASAKYSIVGVVLSKTATCPAPGAVDNVAFSVVGDDLWLFPATEKREVYTKK